ncbi:lactadherin-like [Exaiptasia diaphana]|uniref:F5/8 type C domain-containing protein n=1 Tax=Exaiptasia diaphana TaxID=2652724 RepID=A0A913YP38_EXADI|nr:lactadherin-like [Exaiptasia diaphana]
MVTPARIFCQSECFLEKRCISYNLGPVLGQNRSCELNAADHSTRPDSLVNRAGYEYCPIQNPCQSNPCPGEILCTPDFSWNTYKCDGCKNSLPLGMEDGRIPDENITASSFFRKKNIYRPSFGRLRTNGRTWSADTGNAGEYIQIDLDVIKFITMVATQGRDTSHNQWVTKYSLSYSLNAKDWKAYEEDGVKIFSGNKDRNTVVTNKLERPIKSRHIRLIVKEFHNHISLRMELYGC